MWGKSQSEWNLWCKAGVVFELKSVMEVISSIQSPKELGTGVKSAV